MAGDGTKPAEVQRQPEPREGAGRAFDNIRSTDPKPLSNGRARPLHALGVAVALAATASSFLVLRGAPVAPTAHQEELAQIRPLIAGEKLLFLGRDNFILYELRGSRPFTAVRNYYNPLFVEPNKRLGRVFEKFDFDSVSAETLAEFPFVLTTRAAYASGPPPGYEMVEQTPTYVLWKRRGDPSARRPVESDTAPGARVACEQGAPLTRTTAVLAAEPVLSPASAWSEPTIESGEQATLAVRLPRGRWEASLAYDATRPLTLSVPSTASTPEGDAAPSFEAELPGNLDYRGPGAFYPAGQIESPGDIVTLTASVEDPPLAGRLLGARAVAHLGPIAFTAAAGSSVGGAEAPFPGDGARFLEGDRACGRYGDFTIP